MLGCGLVLLDVLIELVIQDFDLVWYLDLPALLPPSTVEHLSQVNVFLCLVPQGLRPKVLLSPLQLALTLCILLYLLLSGRHIAKLILLT